MKDDMPMAHGLTEGGGSAHDATYECEPAPELAKGSATQGATMNGQGGLTEADLMAGFNDGEYKPPPPTADDTIANTISDLIADEKPEGFLERDHGWAR